MSYKKTIQNAVEQYVNEVRKAKTEISKAVSITQTANLQRKYKNTDRDGSVSGNQVHKNDKE